MALRLGQQRLDVEPQSRSHELVPRSHLAQLRRDQLANPVRRCGLERAPRATPVLPHPLRGPAQPALVGVGRLAREERRDQRLTRGIRQVLGKRRGQRLRFPLQHETEVADLPHRHQPLAPAAPLEHHRGGTALRVAPDRPLRDLRPFDAGTGNSEPIGEVPQRPGDRPPAAAHRPPGDASLLAVRGRFVDYQIERHDLGHEIGEPCQRGLPRERQSLREGQLELAIHRGRAECHVLDRLDEDAAPFGPAIDGLPEEVPRQAVHFPQVAVLVDRFGVDVVCREVVAAGDDQAPQIALFPGHAVQRIDIGRHRYDRDEVLIRMHQQLAPGPLDRHRFDFPSVARQPPPFDQTAIAQLLHGRLVGPPVERHGQVELPGIDAQRRARDRDALGVAGQLELGRGRGQALEREVAVAQDVDLATLHPAVHPSRHLQDLVGPEVEPREHVAAPLDHVGVAGIVDHDAVESADIERGLPGGGHGEQEWALDQTVEKRANHADRLAPVVEGRGEPGPPIADVLGDAFDLRTGRHEHRDPATFPHDPLDETIVQELLRALRQHPDVRRARRIERPSLEHFRRVEVTGVETGIDRGRQPNEAAARPLSQGQAQLHLGGGLVDLVHHQSVAGGDEPVLEPAPGDAGGDDHHVPGGGLRGRFALPVDHADLEGRPQDRLADGANRERLSRAGPRDDAEASPRLRQAADVLPMLPLQKGLQLEA